MRLLRFLISAWVLLSLTACPGEEQPADDAGTPTDAGSPDGGQTLTYFVSDDPVLSKTVAAYENLSTGFEETTLGALELRAQTLGIQATVLTGLASGTDAGLLAFSSTRPAGADVIYDAVTRTFEDSDALMVLAALGDTGFLPTALHEHPDGSLTLVATSVRGAGHTFDLTFRQLVPPFTELEATLTSFSDEGYAAVASSLGARLSVIGARLRGSMVAYEHRSAIGSRDPDAGLPQPGPTISAFGPLGFIVTSVVADGETIYAIGARRTGEMETRINTPRIVVSGAAPLESTEFGFDSLLFFDLEALDGGYLMLGAR